MDDDQPSFTRIIEPAPAGTAPQPVSAGEHPTLVPYASTLATVAALLLLALVAAHRSER